MWRLDERNVGRVYKWKVGFRRKVWRPEQSVRKELVTVGNVDMDWG